MNMTAPPQGRCALGRAGMPLASPLLCTASGIVYRALLIDQP
jgi:hypothetical protein